MHVYDVHLHYTCDICIGCTNVLHICETCVLHVLQVYELHVCTKTTTHILHMYYTYNTHVSHVLLSPDPWHGLSINHYMLNCIFSPTGTFICPRYINLARVVFLQWIRNLELLSSPYIREENVTLTLKSVF